MIILAIDPSRSTGWALFQNGVTTIGTRRFERDRNSSPGMDFLRYGGWLEEMYSLTTRPIDLIVYEKPHHRGGASTELLLGFVTKIKEVAAKHNSNIDNVHTGTLKKWATGKGNASKDEMIAEARRRGFTPQNDDEADAVLLLEYFKDQLGVS